MSLVKTVRMEAPNEEPPREVLWRRQCARNLMDCYAAGMEALMTRPGDKSLEALTRLMVEGMTAVRDGEDERAFYRLAAALCRESAGKHLREAGRFRIYAAIFEDLGQEEGRHA
jgi:hypothetical protein